MRGPIFARIGKAIERQLPRQSIAMGLRLGAAFAAAMLACGIKLPGGLSPFGTALTLALPGNFSLAAFGGSLAGYCLLGGFEENLARMIALICALGVKLLISDLPRFRSSTTFLSASAALVMGACLAARSILGDFGTIDLVFCLAEAALSGALCYFAFHAGNFLLGSPYSGTRRVFSSGSTGTVQRMSLILLSLTFLTGLCQLELSAVNLGQVLVCFLLPAIAARRGAQSALAASACCGAAMILSEPAFAVSAGIYGAAAFWSGHFARAGRVRQGLLYLLIGLAGAMLTGGAALQGALGQLFGTAIFLLLPDKALTLIPQKTEEKTKKDPADAARMAARLRFSAETLEDIRGAVEAVSQKLYATGVCSMENVYDRTADRVCRKCGLKLFCWETAYSQTMDAFGRFTPVLKQKGYAAKEDLPAYFSSKCPKSDEILRTVNSYYQEYTSREAASRKVMEAKQVASEQLEGMAELLLELGEEMAGIRRLDSEKAEEAMALLIEEGEKPEEVWCLIDQYDRMRVEVVQKAPLKGDGAGLAKLMSVLLERPFALPSAVTAGEETRVTFCERARFAVEMGTAQLNAGDGRISGDCCDSFTDSRGYFHLVLSDGMGSGGRAAVDSIMTCSFVMKLLKAGFGFEAALKLINSALLCKAGDETLATLDIGCIDLYTGRMEFLKAGAVSSFLCRDGKVTVIGGRSLPMGILQGVRCDRQMVHLKEGDMIVMVTDGAMAVDESWMKEEVAACSGMTAEAAAKRLASGARRQNGLPGDDITTAVMRLTTV